MFYYIFYYNVFVGKPIWAPAADRLPRSQAPLWVTPRGGQDTAESDPHLESDPAESDPT